jgi:phosphoglycolate phosphatase
MLRQALIFDLDGTLIDTRRDIVIAVNEMRRFYHLPLLAEDVIAGYVGDGVKKLVERAIQGTAVDLEEALVVQRRLYRAHLFDTSTLYPGVEAGLRTLHHRGHSLSVVTNKLLEFTESLLVHFNVRDLFQVVIGDGNAPTLKPHPAGILETLRLTGTPPEAAWVIGDHHTDLESGRRAGVRRIFVTWGIGHPGTETPDARVNSFEELVQRFPFGQLHGS